MGAIARAARTWARRATLVLAVGALAVGCENNRTYTVDDGGDWPDAVRTGNPRGDTTPVAQDLEGPKGPIKALNPGNWDLSSDGTRGGNWPDQPPAAKPAPTPAPVVSYGGDTAAYPTADRGTPQLMVTRSAPTQVSQGEEFTYTYQLCNTTDSPISDVVLVEEISANFQRVSSTPPASGNEWRIPTLASGECQTITITGRATNNQPVQACAEARYRIPLCTNIDVVQPALALQLTAPADAGVCECYPVEVVVTNTGTGTARNVVVNVQLPSGVQTRDGRTTVALSAGDLSAGQSKRSTVEVCPQARGNYTVTADAASSNLSVTGNPVSTAVRQASLTIDCDNPGTMYIGRSVPYTIRVCNNGDAPATNVVLNEMLASGLRVVDAGGNAGLTWNMGTIEPGQCRDVTIRVAADAPGDYSSSARVTGNCVTEQTCPQTISVRGIPAILLEVIDIEDPVLVGEETTYVLTVTNQGSATDTNIRLTCELEGQQFVSGSGATAGTASGNTVTFAPLPSLAPGARAEWRMRVRAMEARSIRLAVTMISDQLTRPVNETEATNQYE